MEVTIPTLKHPKGGYDIGYITLNNEKLFKRRRLKNGEIGVYDNEIYIYVDKTIKWNGWLGPIKLQYLPVYIGKGDFGRSCKHRSDLLASELKKFPERYMCLKCATGISNNESAVLEAYLINYATNIGFIKSKRGATTFITSLQKPILINKTQPQQPLKEVGCVLNV